MAARGGVRVVRAGPRRRATGLLVRFHDADDGPVGASDHQEGADDDDKGGPDDHEDPFNSGSLLLALVPVVVEPHASHRLEAH